jgi:hypothetical protein
LPVFTEVLLQHSGTHSNQTRRGTLHLQFNNI